MEPFMFHENGLRRLAKGRFHKNSKKKNKLRQLNPVCHMQEIVFKFT